MNPLSRVSAAAPYVPTMFHLRCNRCDAEYQTDDLNRTCCGTCHPAAAKAWPGVVELPFHVGGE